MTNGEINLPPVSGDTEDFSLDDKEEMAFLELQKKIASAVQMTFKPLRRQKAEKFHAYINKFNEIQLDMFCSKLKTSSYVRNPNFNCAYIVKYDVINTLLGGTSASASTSSSVSRFYHIQPLYVGNK